MCDVVIVFRAMYPLLSQRAFCHQYIMCLWIVCVIVFPPIFHEIFGRFLAELKSAVGEIHFQDKSVLAVDLNKVLVPPNYNKYVAWGFSDMSLRIGNYDSEKVSGSFSLYWN